METQPWSKLAKALQDRCSTLGVTLRRGSGNDIAWRIGGTVAGTDTQVNLPCSTLHVVELTILDLERSARKRKEGADDEDAKTHGRDEDV